MTAHVNSKRPHFFISCQTESVKHVVMVCGNQQAGPVRWGQTHGWSRTP